MDCFDVECDVPEPTDLFLACAGGAHPPRPRPRTLARASC
jgi:hypothetical protein